MWILEEIIDGEDDVAGAARGAVHRGRAQVVSGGVDESGALEADVRAELDRAVGPQRAERMGKRLDDSARAFRRERFDEAARILKRLAQDAPGAPSVRELYGLTLYRQSKFREAERELEAFRQLTGSVEQHPVAADCARARGDHDRVEALWNELKAVSPGPDLLTEGRLVMAGSLADRDRVADAIRLLAQGFRIPARPREWHLRRAYALADLYERAGDVPRARELFGRVAALDPELGDVRARLRALR